MKVLIAFYSGDRNPYLALLIAGLTQQGIDVNVAPPVTVLPLLRPIFKHGLPDVVHVHWPIYFTANSNLLVAIVKTLQFFMQCLILMMLRVRFVWTVHNIVSHERYFSGWELFACRVFARLVDTLIVHCSAAIELVVDAYHVADSKICVIPHGNLVDAYPSGGDRATARRRLGFSPDATVFLNFGYVRAYKGLNRLLEAFSHIDAPTARLAIVGKPLSDAARSAIQEYSKRDPRIYSELQFIEPERLSDYIRASDIVVLPYSEALTSGAVVLAFSLGRPALVSNVGCMKDLPRDTAILFEPDNASSLLDAMNAAMSSPLDSMGRSAQLYVEQYCWDSVARQTVDVYRGVLGK